MAGTGLAVGANTEFRGHNTILLTEWVASNKCRAWHAWHAWSFRDCPHHVTQRGNRPPADVLPGGRLSGGSQIHVYRGAMIARQEVAPLLAMVADWNALLNSAGAEEELRDLRKHGRTGRSLGGTTFIERLERRVGRTLKPQKPGPKPKTRAN